jgi:hypothetical protein
LLATAGTDPTLQQRIAGIANAELHLVAGSSGHHELDPVATASEYFEGFVAKDECKAIRAARAQLASSPRADAIHRAAKNAANTSSSAELRRLLGS